MFHTGQYDYDNAVVLLSVESAREVVDSRGGVTGLNVRLDDYANAPLVRKALGDQAVIMMNAGGHCRDFCAAAINGNYLEDALDDLEEPPEPVEDLDELDEGARPKVNGATAKDADPAPTTTQEPLKVAKVKGPDEGATDIQTLLDGLPDKGSERKQTGLGDFDDEFRMEVSD